MSDDLNTLESLTDTVIDSAMGYETAADVARTSRLQAILSEQASKRRALINILNGEVVRLGGTVRTGGTTLGAAHRAWASFTDAFASGDKEATEHAEVGEDYLEEKLREALGTNIFDTRAWQILVCVYGEIAEGERLSNRLKEQYA